MKAISTRDDNERKRPSGVSIPRWAALFLGLVVWFVAIPLAHGVLPWAVSLFAPRYGWSEGRPGVLNLLGLIPVLAAAACLIWVMVLGFAQTPKRVELEWNSSFLLMRGPYAYTRNPMYVSELGLWIAWALFYGSLTVAAGSVVLFLVVNNIVLPREERALQERFGDPWCRYTAVVPRWLGRRRR